MPEGCTGALLILVVTLARIYAISVIGSLIMIPVAYVLAPIWHVLNDIPHHIMTFLLELSWYSAIAIVLGWFVDEWIDSLPDQAAQETTRRQTWLPIRGLSQRSLPTVSDRSAD